MIGKLNREGILGKLGFDGKGKEPTVVHARASYNDVGELVDIQSIPKSTDTIIGGNVAYLDKSKLTCFDVEVTFNSMLLMINVLKRIDGKLIIKDTFAESFRLRDNYYPIIQDELRVKLNRYAGIGSGTAVIDIEKQAVTKISVKNGNTLAPNKSSVITKEGKGSVTVTCTFANGGVNIQHLVA